MNHRRSCGQTGGRDVPLYTLEMNEFESAVLSAARHFFSSFASPDNGMWVNAFLNCERFFPGPNSAETMRQVLELVQQIRMARKSCLRFSNPHCACCAPFATEEERYLVHMLQAARKREISVMSMNSMFLCEGHATEAVHASIYHLLSAPQAACEVNLVHL